MKVFLESSSIMKIMGKIKRDKHKESRDKRYNKLICWNSKI